MKQHLKQPIFKIVAKAAFDMKVPAYVIGGYVRDALLNRPSKDVDIVVVGSGIDLARRVAKDIGDNTSVTVFKNFVIPTQFFLGRYKC